ncbi:MAG TPA: alpha-L-rhamnosidase C-terminal domain-containing protein [Sphingobium sp.]
MMRRMLTTLPITALLTVALTVPGGAVEPFQNSGEASATQRTDSSRDAIGAAGAWITHPDAIAADAAKKPIALQFRRVLNLTRAPKSLLVRVSADNRFVLYVNGVRRAAGPARGDMAHWRYEVIDLAPFLKRGTNVITAQVWNDAGNAPAAQITSGHTAFLIQAESAEGRWIDSGQQWEVRVDRSRTVESGMKQLQAAVGPTYYVGGAPEQLTGEHQLANWTTAREAGDWRPAVEAAADEKRVLVADPLPQMRYDAVPSGRVVRAEGVAAAAFPRRALTIPANSKATILIDAGRLLAAYPVLRTMGGAGATVKLTYVESLYDKAKLKKFAPSGQERLFDRSSVEGGVALGLTDTIRPDGRKARFAPYWWRAWRYVQIAVETGEKPLTLDGFDTFETGYPFQQKGHFVSSDQGLDEIFRIGWKTALLDAHETYMDTAYWEQLQYIGDTRIQALISYDVAGDDRLAVQALDAFDGSRVVDGLPQAAWPLNGANSIPPFALLWVGMLHDYWMRSPRQEVIQRNLAGVRAVLDWYAPYVRPDGIVRSTPSWVFVDWKPGLDGGFERKGKGPDSCVVSLIYLGALRQAADLERATGDAARAANDDAAASRVAAGVQANCWDAKRGLYADTPQKLTFSQQTNALAVLYDVAPTAERQAIMSRVMTARGIEPPAGVTGSSYYFSFYLARALDHAGLGAQYPAMIETWRDLLKQNFTTWPETPAPSRSDSHAWSAHPTSGLLTYVAGIQPAAPGFAKVRIAPQLGGLKHLDAAMAHPGGVIRARYKVRGGKLNARLDLPPSVTGSFEYAGKSWPLKPGANVVDAPAAGW